MAGCEAALRIAARGHRVRLIESKPERSPAHKTDMFAELVCSNSLKSTDENTAGGLLKAELDLLDCFLLRFARQTAVPAGNALAVDRQAFSALVTEAIANEPAITLVRERAEDWDPETVTVIASGPLTMGGLADRLRERLGTLYFYDAAAPIVSTESIDFGKAFVGSRYGKGSDDYVNCPLDKDEYAAFVEALVSAETAELKDFDKREVFEGCMPLEIMAKRGPDTLRFGPLRPVGFTHPVTGRRPYAVVQLRKENAAGQMYNLVGFQTNLKFSEQRRVFGMIPALRNCEFLRYGVMHRNSFLNAPEVLDAHFSLRRFPNTFIGGQLSGVEGYVESIAAGLMAGENAIRTVEGKPRAALPETTIIGALTRYLTAPNADFQPMNANFGILPPILPHIKDKEQRKRAYYLRSVAAMAEFKKAVGLN